MYGQLGTGCAYNGRHQCGGNDDSNTPVRLSSLGTDNVMVGAGNRNSLVLKQDGRVLTAGCAPMLRLLYYPNIQKRHEALLPITPCLSTVAVAATVAA